MRNLKIKKDITRKCIASHKKYSTKKMIRIVKTKSGKFHLSDNMKGRGAYVFKDHNFYDKILKHRLLNRAFKVQVPLEIYKKLEKELENNNDK